MKNQYVVKVLNQIKSFANKGQKLIFEVGDSEMLPLSIIHSKDKSKLMLIGQKRIYVNRKGEEIVIEDGYQSFEILQQFKEVDSVVISIDQRIWLENEEFMETIKELSSNIKTKKSISLKITYPNAMNKAKFNEITQLFRKITSFKKLIFEVNGQMEEISETLSSYSQELPGLKLLFLDAPITRINQELIIKLASSLQSLSKLKTLSIDIQGKFGLQIAYECLTQYCNSLQQIKIEQFSFNFESIDFIPDKEQLLPFLKPLISLNPEIKFRIKFPSQPEYHSYENADKIKYIFETFPEIFNACTKISSFHLSTAGNKNYIDNQKKMLENSSDLLNSKRITRSILKKNSFSNIRLSDEIIMSPLSCIQFLKGQKQLISLSLKVDRQIDLNEFGQLLLSVSGCLQKLSIRVKHNQYDKNELDKFMGNLNVLFRLNYLCADLQMVEYIFYQIKAASMPKLIIYKQGKMVKAATDFTINCKFNSDPVKLFQHFLSFKFLGFFKGQFSGFEVAKDEDNYFKGIRSANKCLHLSKTCQKMFKKLLLTRKLLIQVLLYLSFHYPYSKEQIIGIAVTGFVG